MGTMTDAQPPILVAGIGNIFCSDDGFGPEVARRLAAARGQAIAVDQLPSTADPGQDVRVVDYGIRGMHLVYDLLDPIGALIIIDTVPGPGEPGTVEVLEVGPDDLGRGVLDAHGMNPVAVLASLGDLGGVLPKTYLVGCVPAVLSDGLGLSSVVTGAVHRAVTAVEGLLADLRVAV